MNLLAKTRLERALLTLGFLAFFAGCSSELEHVSKFDPKTNVDNQAKATLSGRITLEGEQDHAGVEIRLKGPTLTDISTQADGTFAVNQLIPGNYTLTISERGWEEVTRDVVLDIGQIRELVGEELPLRKNPVKGSLVSTDGKALDFSGSKVTVNRIASPRSKSAATTPGELHPLAFTKTPYTQTLTIDENNEFYFPALESGQWEVRVQTLLPGNSGCQEGRDPVLADACQKLYDEAQYRLVNGDHSPEAHLAPAQTFKIDLTGDGGLFQVPPVKIAPLSGDLAIRGTLANGGLSSETYTATPSVKLLLTAANAFKMILGEEIGGECLFGAVEDFNVAPVLNLSAGDGVKTVCVILANEDASQTVSLRSSIVLDTTPPQLSLVRINAGAAYSTVNTIPLELVAYDNQSGLDKIARTRNGADIGTVDYVPVFSDTVTADGSYSYALQVIDRAGNASAAVTSSVTLDRVAPSNGTIAINGGAAWTDSAQVQLQLSVTGATEMMLGNEGSFAGSLWEPYRTQVVWFLVATNGNRSVAVQFRDAAGNVSGGFISASIGLDTVAPSSPTLSINAGSAATNSTSVQLSLSAVNATQIQISNDGQFDSEPWQTYATTVNGWPVASGDDTKTIYVRFADDANNLSAVASDSIVLDTAAPANTSLSIDAGAVYSTNAAGTVGLTLAAVDFGTAVSKMKVANLTSGACSTALAAASEEAFVSSRSWVVATPGAGVEGDRAVCAAFGDATGNWSAPVSDSIHYDTLAPQIVSGDVVINGGATRTSDRLLQLALNPRDAVEIQLNLDASFGGVFWQPATTSTQLYVSRSDGTITVYLRGRDAAGNVSEIVSGNIILDTTPPDAVAIALADIDGDGYPLTHKTAELSWSATGDPNAVAYELERYVIGSSSAFEPVTSTSVGTEFFADDITATAGRVHQYRVRVLDSLGQASQWSNVLAVNTMAADGQLCWVVNQTDGSDISYTLVPPTGAISSQVTSSLLDMTASDNPVVQTYPGNALGMTQTRRALDVGEAGFTMVSTNLDSVYRQQGSVDAPMGWHWDTVDRTETYIADVKVRLDAAGNVHILYADAGGLKYTARIDGVWQSPLVLVPSDVFIIQAEIDANGALHVAYVANSAGKLMYLTNRTGSWAAPVELAAGSLGTFSALRLDGQQQLHLAFTDGSTLRYIKTTGGVWGMAEDVTTAGAVNAKAFGLDVDSQGAAHISYQGSDRMFRYVNNVGGSWNAYVQPEGAMVMSDYNAEKSFLRVDAAGTVHIIEYVGDPYGSSGKYYWTNAGGTWASVNIEAGWDSLGVEVPAYLDRAGTLHVVESKDGNKLNYRTRLSNGTWSADQVINPSQTVSQFFDVVADDERAAHIIYVANKELRYATNMGSVTNGLQAVQTTGPIFASLAVDSKGVAHSVYPGWQQLWENHTTSSGTWTSRAALTDTSEFVVQAGLAIDPADQLHTVYPSYSFQSLRYMYYNGVTWSAPVSIDTSIGYSPEVPSIKAGADGVLHVAYFDAVNADLRYVEGTPGNWSTPVTVDASGDTGHFPSLAVGGDGSVHIAYIDETSGMVKYARRTQGGWDTPVAVAPGYFQYARNPLSLGVDSKGFAHITFFGTLDTGLKYVNNSKGTFGTPLVLDVLANGAVGSSLAVDSHDQVHVAYFAGGVMKYTWFTGRKWITPAVVASGLSDFYGDVGGYPTLALDRHDHVHMLVFNGGSFASKYKYLGNEAGCSEFSDLKPISPF